MVAAIPSYGVIQSFCCKAGLLKFLNQERFKISSFDRLFFHGFHRKDWDKLSRNKQTCWKFKQQKRWSLEFLLINKNQKNTILTPNLSLIQLSYVFFQVFFFFLVSNTWTKIFFLHCIFHYCWRCFLSYWTVILDVKKVCKATWVKVICLDSPRSAKVSLCISNISVENSFHRK